MRYILSGVQVLGAFILAYSALEMRSWMGCACGALACISAALVRYGLGEKRG